MKYLAIIFSSVLFACDKDTKEDDKECWECKVTVSSVGYNSSSNHTVCNKTRGEIVEYMKEGTGTTTTNQGGTTVRVSTGTKCELQR